MLDNVMIFYICISSNICCFYYCLLMMLFEEIRMLYFVFVKFDNLLVIDYVFFIVLFLFCYFFVNLFNLFDDLLVYLKKFEKGYGRCFYGGVMSCCYELLLCGLDVNIYLFLCLFCDFLFVESDVWNVFG